MTRITRILPVLTFMISVAVLVLTLWQVVGDAPWEDRVTEAELSEILQEEAEASAEEKEADRKAKCEGIYLIPSSGGSRVMEAEVKAEIYKIALENHCYREDGSRRY